MSLFDDLDLGAGDYDKEKDPGLSQFTSKPIQRQYQPFGGPAGETVGQQRQRMAEENGDMWFADFREGDNQLANPPQPQPYQNFNDLDLDAYEQAKKQYTYISQDASAHSASAKLYEDRYDDFVKTKFRPYYQSLGGFDGDFETDDDYANAIEDMYKNDLALSKSEDGFFGESDEKIAARGRLKGFTQWNSPNGLRDQFQRLKQEKEMRRAMADRSNAQKSALMDQMTMLPRMQLDDALKARKSTSSSKPRSKKATDEMLNQMQFEKPVVDMVTGEVTNLERTDPRKSVPSAVNMVTGQRTPAAGKQTKRLEAAMRGDMAGFMTRRESVAKDRQMRDRGMLFSQNGMLDGYPVGMSRMDTDILDIEKAQKMGIKEYKGRPIEEAFNELGGEERLNVAKIMNAVRSAYSNREKAQIDWLAGNRKEELKAPMEQANESFEKALQLAAQFGLTDEIVEQTESKGFFSRMADSMKNAFSRGMKMNEMSKYADDFFLNAADQSEIEKFIQAAEELGEIPTSSAAKKFQNYKSKGLWDSVSNLLFDNPEAIPELFVESMSSFLPAYVRTGMYTIPGAAAAGGAAGLAGGPLAPATVTGGALSGAGIAARLNWGTASMVLEYSGMVLQGMQELNIDWQNPKVFAAAWNNQITRDAIKDKALKKGLPIALLDAFSGMMAGKVSAALHHGGNAIKGGKLIDGAAWKRSKQTYPRFTNFQRGANIGLEIGADAAAGMGGEFLGQAWSKEPGEAWDYNAIAAEGLIGLGPGLLGGAYEFSAKPNVSFEGTPFDYEGVRNTQTGQTGTVNLAGFRNQFHSFNDARPAAAHVLNEGNYANAEAKDNATRVLTDIMGRLYAINPDAMKDLKIVVADRTPYADKEMEGSYHFDNETQTSVIYINRNKIGQDPLGVFLHEAGHLARHLMMDKAELINIYDSIGPDAQNDAFAQYTLKIPEIKYSQLDDAQKAQVDKAKNSKDMSKLRMAEEWFSYQFANLLAGHKVDPSVKTEYQNFLSNVIHPAMEKFIGGETTGGNKEQKFNFDQMILRKMGFNPDGTPKEGPKFGQYYQERAGMAERFFGNDMPIQQMGDEEALNHLMRKVAVIAQTEGEARAKQVAEATNKILGKNILPTEMSAYTNLELQEAITPLGEAQIDAQDAVATAEVLETLEGEDAKAGVNELVEEVEVGGDISTIVTETAELEKTLKKAELELQTAQTEFDSAKRAGQSKEQKSAGKRVVRAKQTIKGAKEAIEKAKNLPAKAKGQKVKVARVEKDIDKAIDQTTAKINETQLLMPGAKVTQKGDKFELRTRQPGTRKAGSAKTFDTKEAAEKAKEDFYKAELKKLKDTSQAVTNLKKLVLNQKEYEKEATKVKAKLLKELNKNKADVNPEIAPDDPEFIRLSKLEEKALEDFNAKNEEWQDGKITDQELDDARAKLAEAEKVTRDYVLEKKNNPKPEAARSSEKLVKDATAEVRRINEEIEKNKSDIQALDDEFQDASGTDLEEGSDFLKYYDKKKPELEKKSRELELELMDAQLARDLFRKIDDMDFKSPDSVINYRSKIINLSKGGKNQSFIMSPDDSTEMSNFLKEYLRIARNTDQDASTTSTTLTEEDITFGQIIAEMMDLNGLQANAIFSSALAGDRLSELASMKAPDGQRVVQIFEEYEQKVESASFLIGQRIVDLEKRKEAILNPEALGSAQAKKGGTPPGKWVVVFRSPDGKWKKWQNGKWVNAPKLDDNKFIKSPFAKAGSKDRLDSKIYRYVAADKKAADKALNEKQRRFVRFWREPTNKAAPAKKAAAKPAAKAKAEPEKSEKKKELTKEQKAELTEINKKITMLKQYLDAIQPEKAAIDWKDTPHMTYHKYVGGPGKMSFKEENFERYTLGELASTQREDDTIWQKIWNKKRNRHEFVQVKGVSDTQDYLFKYTNWRLNEQEQEKAAKPEPKPKPKPKAEVEKKAETEAAPEPEAKPVDEEPTALGSGLANPDQSQAFNPFINGRKLTDKLPWFGDKTVQEYLDLLDAVRASAAMPENVGERAIGKAVKSKGKEVGQKDRIYFQPQKGTTVAAMMLFRLKEMDRKSGVNSRQLINGNLDRVTLSEMTVYELATGRAMEILDDREFSGYKQQRYHQVIERKASEMAKDIEAYEKLLAETDDPKEKERIERILNGSIAEIEAADPNSTPGKDVKGPKIAGLRQQLAALIFDYDEIGAFQGEETGGAFAKIHGGKVWTETLTEFMFYREKADAVQTILDIWEEDIANDQGPGMGRKPKERRNAPEQGAIDSWLVYQALKRTPGVTQEDVEASLAEFRKKAEEAKGKFEETYAEKAAEEETQAAKAWGTETVAPDDYVFFGPGEKATSKVKETSAHGSFARGAVDEGIPVLSMFGKGRADNFKPEKTTFGTGSGSEQANIGLAADLDRKVNEQIQKKLRNLLKRKESQNIDAFEITKSDGKTLKVKRVNGAWKKGNNTKLPKDLQKIAEDSYINSRIDVINSVNKDIENMDADAIAGVSSGAHVSAVQLVEFLLSQVKKKGGGKDALKNVMKSLEYNPSSETKEGIVKQLPGGPAGGLLPYVWFDFITALHKKLKIKTELKLTEASDPSKSGWKNIADEMIRTVIGENGKQTRILEKNDLYKNGIPDMDAMVEMVKPIIQAVYNSGRLRLNPGRGFDEKESTANSANAANVLQRDPMLHDNPLDAVLGYEEAPEGSFDNMEVDSATNKDQAKQTADDLEESVEGNFNPSLEETPYGLIGGVVLNEKKGSKFPLLIKSTDAKNHPLKKGDILAAINVKGDDKKQSSLLKGTFEDARAALGKFLKGKRGVDVNLIVIPKGKQAAESRPYALGSSFSPSTKNKVLKLLAPRNLNRLFVENGLEDEMSDDGNYYDSKGDIIPLETPSSLRNLLNLCLSTMSGTIEKAKNLGLKARPGHIIAKNPAIEDTYIDHAVALVTIDGVEYVVDDPQTNFIKGGVVVPTPEEIAWEAGMIDLIEEQFEEMVAEDEYLSNTLTAKELKKRKKEYLDKNWPRERGGVQLKDKFEPYLIPLNAKALKKEYGKEAMNMPGFWQPMNVSFVEVPRLVKGAGPLKESTYGITSLGSSYSLSSGIPTNALKTSTVLTRMANKVGLDDEGKKALKDYFAKKKDDLKSGDIISSFVDQSRAGTKFISDTLRSMGIEDQALLDQLDVQGLWHQYYGKTDEQVKQAEMRFIEPVMDALSDHGISQEEFGEYLIARMAPSRNIHLKKMYTEMMNELDDGDKKNSLKEMLEKRGDNLSGVATDIAIKVVKKMEAEPAFLNFLQDSREPLQKFYDMNLEGLKHRAESELIRSSGDINEAKAMRLASSFFNWKKDGGSKFSFKDNGKDDNYSYAPMQGFEGGTDTLYEKEEAYGVVGKSSSSSGRAWDQPKNKFLFKGAFGRPEDSVGPNPETVFAVARQQYFEGGVRGAKNEVSNSFGAAFELFRAVAYHGKEITEGEPLAPLPPSVLERIEKDPSIIETAREMFEGKDAIFEKDFKQIDIKKDYEIVEKDILVDGKKVEGLRMVTREINTEFQNDPYVFVYRKNGVPHYVQFKKDANGGRVARSIKNLRYEALPTFLKGVNSVTRFMASMFTSRNPAFIIPNFIRDLGTAFIHLSEDDKKKFIKATFSPKRLKGFMFETMKVERKAYKGEIVQLDPKGLSTEEYAKKLIREGDYQRVYQLAKEAGAKVGYFRAKSVPELLEEMEKYDTNSKKGMRGAWNSFVNLLDVTNTGVENSIRMSAFASAVEAGYTVHQAASISRNVTVDFNQKGEMTQTMGSLFVFFGASMNSMHRMMSTFKKRSPAERKKLILTIAGASFGLSLFNRIMDDDEDEPIPDYDTISSYRRDTMAIVGDPRDKNTGYFGIPIPLGYNMFWALGQTAGDFFAKTVMGRGGAGPVDFLTRNLNATLNAFNPIGGSTLATAMIPTVGKPVAELWANQNFMGMPIRNEDRPYEAPKPAHMMDPKRTQEHWTALSEGLNNLLGGSDEVKGSVGGLFGGSPLNNLEGTDMKFDISGSQMEHLLLGYAGGPGQIANAMFGGLIFPAMSEEKDYGKFDPNKMPIANRFYRSTTHGSRVKNLYYQVREANKIADRAIKAAKIAGPKEFNEAQKNLKGLLALSSNIKYADAFKKKVAAQKSKVEVSKSLTQDQKLQRIAQLEQREHDAYVKVIKKAQSLGIS